MSKTPKAIRNVGSRLKFKMNSKLTWNFYGKQLLEKPSGKIPPREESLVNLPGPFLQPEHRVFL